MTKIAYEVVLQDVPKNCSQIKHNYLGDYSLVYYGIIYQTISKNN